MILGVTGTRHLNERGRRHIAAALAEYEPADTTLVVGGCVGADEFAGRTGRDMGMTVHVVLPRERRWVDPLWGEYATTSEEGGVYRARNERIVALATEMVAFPNHPEGRDNPHSGTWMTIRIARRVGKPITITPQNES